MTRLLDPRCSEESRQQLLQQALSGAQGAQDVKLILRTSELANEASLQWISIAQRHRTSGASARTWLAGACASFALVALFSLHQPSTQLPQAVKPQTLASNHSDHFGASGSFEGVVQESDAFGRLNFEAN